MTLCCECGGEREASYFISAQSYHSACALISAIQSHLNSFPHAAKRAFLRALTPTPASDLANKNSKQQFVDLAVFVLFAQLSFSYLEFDSLRAPFARLGKTLNSRFQVRAERRAARERGRKKTRRARRKPVTERRGSGTDLLMTQ